MARSPKPMPLWIPIVAAVCFALAAVLQTDTFSTVMFSIAAAAHPPLEDGGERQRRREH